MKFHHPSVVRELRYLIVYCCIGFCGVGVDMLLFYMLCGGGLPYMLANCLSVCSGIIVNFTLNSLFNFRKSDYLLTRFLKFFSVGLIGLGLSSLALYLFIEYWAFHPVLAKVVTIGLVTAFQFISNRLITFKDIHHETNPPAHR